MNILIFWSFYQMHMVCWILTFYKTMWLRTFINAYTSLKHVYSLWQNLYLLRYQNARPHDLGVWPTFEIETLNLGHNFWMDSDMNFRFPMCISCNTLISWGTIITLLLCRGISISQFVWGPCIYLVYLGDGFVTTNEFKRNAASLFAAGIVKKCTKDVNIYIW